MAPLRVGVIGIGAWGKVCLRAIANLDTLMRLSAVASSNPTTANLVQCPVFSNWRDLLNSGTCDGVIVTTPPESHAEITLAALGQGLPVLLEKPMALCPAEARAMRAVALRTGIPLMVDHIHLFSPAFRMLRSMATRLGPVLSIRGMAGKPGACRPERPVLWDWGVHDVVMTLAIMGAVPIHVDATVQARPIFSDGLGEVVQLELAYDTASATLCFGTLERRTRWFEVRCQGGVLVYDDTQAEKLVLDGHAVELSPTLPLDVALTDFVQAVRLKQLDREGLDFAVDSVEILHEAQRCLT